jgi:cytochrome c-type biogenesis protein CcmH
MTWLFFAIAVGMVTLATLALVLPFRKPATFNTGDQADNLAILRDQLQQLTIDFSNGRIDHDQLELAQNDIAKRVLLEEQAIAADLPSPATKKIKLLIPVLLISIGLPVLAVSLYLIVGSPFAIDAPQRTTQNTPSQQDIEGMVARLAEKLQADPNNAQGWQMLARSYLALQRLPEAVQAYSKAVALAPNDAQLLIDYADLLAFQNRSTKGEPMQLIQKALVLDPKNLKVLALAGTAYFELGDYAKAEKYWQQAYTLAPAESDFAKGMAENITAAKNAAAKK